MSRLPARWLIGIFTAIFVPAVHAGPPKDRWGIEVNGIQVAIRMLPEHRDEFHPGEILKWLVLVNHARAEPLQVPWNDSSGQHVMVHVLTPEGNEFTYDPLTKHMNPTLYKFEKHWRPSTKGNSWSVLQSSWRLSDLAATSQWINVKSNQEAPISLRNPGTYRMWAEYEIVAAQDAPANAWQGKATSEFVEWKLSELPVKDRTTEPTVQQEQDVRSWLEWNSNRKPPIPPEWDRIHESITWTQNEGLALRLASIATNKPEHALNAMYLLAHRTGTLSEIGVDGPYLKEAANAVMLVLEDEYDIKQDFPTSFPQYQLLMVYLHLHPDDKAMVDRAVGVAKQYCKLDKGGHRIMPAHKNRFAGMPLNLAWTVLLQNGVLFAGMTIEEAVAILGEPTHVKANRLSWVLASQSQSITGISASTNGGIVTNWPRELR